MNLKTNVDLNWMLNTSSVCLILWEEAVDVAWMEQSMLGPSIRMMTRHKDLAHAIRALSDVDKTPGRVVLCLPRECILQRTLDYPASVQADLDSMIRFEAARHVPLADAERRIAYSSAVWPDGEKLSVNLVGARQSVVNEHIAPFIEAGIPVDCAVAFSPFISPTADGEPVAMLVCDQTTIEVTLYADGVLRASLRIDRPADAELKDVLAGTIRRLSAPHRERLGAEGVGRMVFAGPVPVSSQIQEEISSTFGLAAHELTIPEELDTTLKAFDGPILPEVLNAVSVVPSPAMNLIDFAERKVPLSRRAIILSSLCALLLVEVLIGWAVWTCAPTFSLGKVNDEVNQIKRRAAPVQEVRNQNRDLRRELKVLNELGQSHSSPMDLLKVLTDGLPEDTYLEAFEYERGDDLKLRGRSKTPDELPALILSLPFVKTIEASKISEKQNDYHGFTMTLALRSLRDE